MLLGYIVDKIKLLVMLMISMENMDIKLIILQEEMLILILILILYVVLVV